VCVCVCVCVVLMQVRPGSIIVTFELLPAEEDVAFTEDLLDTLVTAVRPLLPCPYPPPLLLSSAGVYVCDGRR